MALPLIALGGLLGACLVKHAYDTDLAQQDKQRRSGNMSKGAIGRYPCQNNYSQYTGNLSTGQLVCCEVFHGFWHLGVMIHDDLVVELNGNGLIRAISLKRFLTGRSGDKLFVACDMQGKSLIDEAIVKRAENRIFDFIDYHVFERNCYHFIWQLYSEEYAEITHFEDFNQHLARHFKQAIYWDCLH